MNLTKICKSAKKSANDLASLSNLKRNKILEDLSKNLDKRKEFLLKLSESSKILLIFEIDLEKEPEAHRLIFND